MYGARPVVAIFTRSLTDDLASLVKQIDDKVGENKDKKMAAFVILLSDDPDADEPKLKALKEKHGIKHTPLTILDGIAGPPKYNVAEDADLTVLVWLEKSVKANHALAKGKLDKEGIKKIVESTSTILE